MLKCRKEAPIVVMNILNSPRSRRAIDSIRNKFECTGSVVNLSKSGSSKTSMQEDILSTLKIIPWKNGNKMLNKCT